ncbi:MAG: hypothetical protein ACOCQA_00245 [bacterium]
MEKNNRGFYPFWFWNAEIKEEEVRYQIKEMAAQGIKGFFIHPRQGLKQPYLSNSYFKMIKLAVSEAYKYGLEVELYDEYPYPSGVAGGEVILGNPHYQATYLEQSSYLVKNGSCRLELEKGKVLSAQAYPIKENGIDFGQKIDLKNEIGISFIGESYSYDGLTQYNKKRYFGNKPRPVLDTELDSEFAKYKIYITIQKKVENHKYWYNYVDVFNPDAVNEFLKLTHERYKHNFMDEFGKTIKSIFTDETAPEWSHILIDEFKEKYNYDLLDSMTALQAKEHPDHLQVKKDLYQLKYELFTKNFDQKIADWCKKNNLDYCGEKPSLRLSQLKYMDIPGCEPGHTKAGADIDIFQTSIRGNARAASAADYFYNKKGSLCECYHSIGWSGNLEDAKIIAEGLLLAGINYLVPHGFFYSTHGLRKHDAPPSFFFQMPFWPLFGELSNRIETINNEFQNTYIDTQSVIFEPHSGLPEKKELSKYKDIINHLVNNQKSFQIVDFDILKEGNIKSGYLQLKDLKVKNIILPPLNIKSKKLEKLLTTFKENKINIIDFNINSEIKQLNELITDKNFDLKIKSNQNLKGLLYVKRKGKKDLGKNIYFFVNTKDKKVKLKINNNKNLKEVVLSKVDNISDFKRNSDYYTRTVYPFESFMLKESEAINFGLDLSREKMKIDVNGNYKYNLKNKNLLRISNWKLTIQNDFNNIQIQNKIECAPLKNILDENQIKYKPTIKNFFGSESRLSLPEFSLEYEYQFKNNYSGEVELLLEQDSIKGDWKIQINNSPFLTYSDFYKTNTHIRGSLATKIQKYLFSGTNILKVYLETKSGDDGIVNPFYLAGDFGVNLKNNSLTVLKDKIKFEKYKINEIPFYSGIIEYNKDFELSQVQVEKYKKQKKIIIEPEFPDEFHDAAEIRINNSEYIKVLWEPRKFLIETSNLKVGTNQICIKVYSSLIRSYEGMEFSYSQHKYNSL